MKIKKIVGAALMLSLSMGILACIPDNEVKSYDEDKEFPIKVIDSHQANRAYFNILRDSETGVEYLYLYSYDGSCAICPRLDKNGKPIISK